MISHQSSKFKVAELTMKFLVVLLVICSCVLNTQANCRVGDQEWECGRELQMTKYEVQTIYHNPSALRSRYTSCVWRKLGYQNENGVINYSRIRSDAGALLAITRICEELTSVENPVHFNTLLVSAIDVCKVSLSALEHSEEAAEQVRKCIHDNMSM